MDTKAIPILASNELLQKAWDVMAERQRSNVLVQRASKFYSYTDEVIAEAIANGVKRFTQVTDKGQLIDLMKPVDFSKGLESLRHTVNRRRIQDNVELAFQKALGMPHVRPVKADGELMGIVNDVLAQSRKRIAIVGIQFGEALVFSQSEQDLYTAGMSYGAPGFYECDCKSRHVLQPRELFNNRCPIHDCAVRFSR